MNACMHTYTTLTHTVIMHRITSLTCSKRVKKHPIQLAAYCTMSTCATLARTAAHIHTAATPLTLPAEKVTMGKKMMPSLASGTFVQTAASTAITAPDW